MKKQNTIVSLVIVVVAVALFIWVLQRPRVEEPAVNTDMSESEVQDFAVMFMCDDSKTIRATFHLPEDSNVELALSDGRGLSLGHVVSGSGARYANADESIVFWGKGDTAFLTEGETNTYSNCMIEDEVL